MEAAKKAITHINAGMLIGVSVWLIGLILVSQYDVDFVVIMSLDIHVKQAALIFSTIVLTTHSLFYSGLLQRKTHRSMQSLIYQIVISAALIIELIVLALVQVQLNTAIRKNSVLTTLLTLLMLSLPIVAIYLIIYYTRCSDRSLFEAISVLSVGMVIICAAIVLALTLSIFRPIVLSLLIKTPEQPTVVADKGNQHYAPGNSVEAIAAVAVRKYAKEVIIDVRMTNDSVLVGMASDFVYQGHAYAVEAVNYTSVAALPIGKEWIRLDPYQSYSYAKYQMKQLDQYLQNILDFEKMVETSKINTLEELLTVSLRFFIPIVLDLHPTEERGGSFVTQLVKTLQTFGFTSIDKTSFYKLKTDNFYLYQSVACAYPFIKFLLPIQAIQQDWDSQLSCSGGDLIKTTEKSIFGYLTDITKLRKTRNSDYNIRETWLINTNSHVSFCFAKHAKIDKVTTTLELEDIKECQFSAFVICYSIIVSLLWAAVFFSFAARLQKDGHCSVKKREYQKI